MVNAVADTGGDEREILEGRAADLRNQLAEMSTRLSYLTKFARKAQRQLNEQRRRAQSATLARTRFLTNMSHELRTPMTAILGFADAILEEAKEGDLSAQYRDWLVAIRRNGNHLQTILDDILDLAKIESGSATVEQIPCAPGALVGEVLELMSERASQKGLGFDAGFEGAIPDRLVTDPQRLRQILLNVIGNAIKFTSKGGVRVIVDVFEPEEGPPQLRVRVTDTGCGMSPEALETAFDAFAQGDSSVTRRHGGVGLGLTISKHLAHMLGGDLGAGSIEGEGSTFTLTLPAARHGEITEADIDPDEPETTTGPMVFPELLQPVRGRRILLVEDGEDNRKLITSRLRKAGLEVVVAENGVVGVDRALEAVDRGQPYDLILMDMQMPIMSGQEATRELRANGLETPIIALTANALAADREACLDAGCNAFATKPIDWSELAALLLDHLVEAP